MGLFSSQLLKVIEWQDDTQDTIVYKFPMDGKRIMAGSKLTVRESQVAVFVNNGKLADIFRPGMYTLDSSNLPILTALLSLPYGFKSPFYSEVYFINTKQFTNQKWGTTNPITLRDADFGTIRIRGYGAYSFRVSDPERLLQELFGTNSEFTTQHINDYLKTYIVAGISDTIAESKISALDLAGNLLEFNELAKKQIGNKFLELGLELVNLVVENFSFPPEVEKAIDTSSSMGIMGNKMDTFVKYQAAQAMREAANNQSNNMASAGISMGAGLAMGNIFAGAMNNTQANTVQNTKSCPSCKSDVPANSKFCPMCGASMAEQFCPNCGNKIAPNTKFCPNCGTKI